MKRLLAFFLGCIMLLTGCAAPGNEKESLSATNSTISGEEENTADSQESSAEELTFSGLDDPDLLQYVEDDVYAALESEWNSEDYIIENVSAAYISKEYLEELNYNSQENIYFGYTLSEIESQFEGERYIFTLGEDGQTTVQEFQAYDDTFDRILKDIAIGTGVVLISVTASVVSGGLGLPAVSVVLATSAKTGTTFALSSGIISGLSTGIITGIETGDFNTALKAAAVEGSENFKWGAITGVITGGASKALRIRKTSSPAIPSPREAEIRALKDYGGREQVSYLGGKEVSRVTSGATRPDIVRNVNGHLEAIEVKNYNLESVASRNELYRTLYNQVGARIKNMPKGSTQRIVLNVEGRKYSKDVIPETVSNIKNKLSDIYPNIPIDIAK